eukprot:980564-Pelagomonas_calceolata.AAC.1
MRWRHTLLVLNLLTHSNEACLHGTEVLEAWPLIASTFLCTAFIPMKHVAEHCAWSMATCLGLVLEPSAQGMATHS